MTDEASTAKSNAGSNQIAASRTEENAPPQPVATERQLQKTEQKIEERMSAFERSMIRLTWAAVIISVLSFVVFAGQLYEMWAGGTATDKLVEYAKTQANASSDIADAAQQFSDTADDTNASISDATDQLRITANNAKQSLDASIAQFRLEQRAWVGVSSHSVTKFDQNGVIAAIMLSNTGRTPARNVRVHVRTAAVNTTLDGPSEDEIKSLTAHPWEQKSDIPPEGRMILSINEFPSGQNFTTENRTLAEGLKFRFQAIKDGRLHVYYYGVIRYEDVSHRQHSTKFCLFIGDPSTNPPGMNVCPEFNSMD